MNADEKLCTRCKEIKPREAFGRHPQYKSGLKSWCKQCHSNRARERYQNGTDTRPAYRRAVQAALKRLKDSHLEEYRLLLDEERTRVGLQVKAAQ